MGSEGRQSVRINVTGFKKFQGVDENPTEIIVSNLRNYVESKGLLPAGVNLGICCVLETAADGAISQFYKVLESGISTNDEKVVWLHLGVNTGALKFAIERQAVNEATFCCPDELGWQPQAAIGFCCAGLFREGLVVHCRAIVLGVSKNVYIGSALIDLYLQMGYIDIGLRLFSTLQERNLATWNVVLRRFCEMGRSKELLGLYNDLKLDGLEPNGLTFCYLIQGCGYERFLDEGMQLHCCVIKNGLIDSNLFVANALVDFYSACGSLIETVKLFEVIPQEDVISWNSMVSVYAANGYAFDAIGIFRRMQFSGKKPSACSFLGFLKLSSATQNIFLGKQIHCSLLKSGFETVLVRSGLIDMYGKCGDIESSVKVFYSVPERTIECCNPLMTSLLRFGLVEDVVDLFGLMVDEKIGYDEVSLSSALKALPFSLPSCSLLHCCTIKSGFESDIPVVCSLIDAYSKSGELKFSFIFSVKSPPQMTGRRGKVIVLFDANSLRPTSGQAALFVVHQNEEVGIRAAKMLMDLEPENPSGWLQASKFYSDIGDFESMRQCREIAVARKVRREIIGWSLIEVRGDH
ncbi:hypothetical protein DH2020_049728 [Rehmannia glutinosa]|uniref:Pentatricopeptide repeat-containing protein n=1 Tax=Rehmannia glutinosa TaxID=99300 RepID=A0ABR0U205_REHGL